MLPPGRLACLVSLALLPSIAMSALAEPARSPGGADDPALHLAERLELQMQQREAVLRDESLEHYALIDDVDPADLRRWVAPVSFRLDDEGVVLGVDGIPELHGGGIVAFLLDQWRPDGRAARLEDRFPFQGQGLALATIYAGHRRQIFLPVPGRPAEAIRGAIPDPPQLARMRFGVGSGGGQTVERDAYSFLRLLVAREDDFAATWVNGVAQRLSVDLLLRQAWESYLTERSAAAEGADHSRLHLVEILLAYQRRGAEAGRPAGGPDPDAIKRRFLEVELARPDAEADDERLAHYAESLGWLVADPHVTWSPAERGRVRDWLRHLDEQRFRDLSRLEGRYLAHLLKGLRMVRSHHERLAIP